jgi:hypothetical protein
MILDQIIFINIYILTVSIINYFLFNLTKISYQNFQLLFKWNKILFFRLKRNQKNSYYYIYYKTKIIYYNKKFYKK